MKEQNTQYREPFNPGLNEAIMYIASRLVPDFGVSDHAPATYAELKRHLDEGKRHLVSHEGSEKTIFGAPEVNYAFRAWHDWCHWHGEFDFSLYGECATCSMQISHLCRFFGVNDQTEQWSRLLIAEIIGQRQYYERHRAYICDQRAFVQAYLVDSEDALSKLW